MGLLMLAAMLGFGAHLAGQSVEHLRATWRTTDGLTVVWEPAPPTRILAIGDSHSNGTFGTALHDALSADGAEVTVIGSCGRWTNAWLSGLKAHCGLRTIYPDGRVEWGLGCKRNPCPTGDKACAREACRTPKIDQLLARLRPDLVVVQLGGNSIFRGGPRDHWAKITPVISALVAQIHAAGSGCLWLTPPHGLNKLPRTMRRFRDAIIAATAGRCAVFDSGPEARPYLNYQKALDKAGIWAARADQIHYDRLGRSGRWRLRRWAKEAAVAAKDVLNTSQGPTLVTLGRVWGRLSL